MKKKAETKKARTPRKLTMKQQKIIRLLNEAMAEIEIIFRICQIPENPIRHKVNKNDVLKSVVGAIKNSSIIAGSCVEVAVKNLTGEEC
jgi:hypothetical protein